MRRLARKAARAIVKRVRSALEEPISPIDQWRRSLDGALEIGSGTKIDQGRLEVRCKGARISLGSASDIRCNIILEKDGSCLRVGSRTHIGGGTLLSIASRVEIGDDVLISFDALIMDHNGHSLTFELRKNDLAEWMEGRKDWEHVPIGPIVIKDKAWIGARCIILKGVTIGEGAVVGAGSVVTRNVQDWTIVAGNPAYVIREMPH